jgi:hypothetical protein
MQRDTRFRRLAEREIVEIAMNRMKEYLDGTREFDDAITIEEYVVELKVQADWSVEPKDSGTIRYQK